VAFIIMKAEFRTLILAGHDTTASTLTWWLWELSKHPDWQTRVREELMAVRKKITERGEFEFSISDLEGMTVMHATLKVRSVSSASQIC
jgi:alkylphenol/PAH-inducible cytochrome P450 monooxygenase